MVNNSSSSLTTFSDLSDAAVPQVGDQTCLEFPSSDERNQSKKENSTKSGNEENANLAATSGFVADENIQQNTGVNDYVNIENVIPKSQKDRCRSAHVDDCDTDINDGKLSVQGASQNRSLSLDDKLAHDYSSHSNATGESGGCCKCKCASSDFSPSPSSDCSFICDECAAGNHMCFTCKRANHKTIQCSMETCGRYYHMECLSRISSSQRASGRVVCMLHTCATCIAEISGKSSVKPSKGVLLQCVRCPTAYHAKCCVPAGTKFHDEHSIECVAHRPNTFSLVSSTWCLSCSRDGDNLISCSTCPAAFHISCLNINFSTLSTTSWQCRYCSSGRLPLYGEVVWAKIANYRWWPAEVCDRLHCTASELESSNFMVKLFVCNMKFVCSRGSVLPFSEGDKLSHEQLPRRLRKLYCCAVNQAVVRYRRWAAKRRKCTELEQDGDSRKPAPYKHIKVNFPIGDVEILRPLPDELPRCECTPDMEEPCGPDTNCINRVMFYECHQSVCRAGERCLNQRFQRREDPKLEKFLTGSRGWGLRCKTDIKKGQFISEYVGDLINKEEAERRLTEAYRQKISNFYMMTLDDNRIIDAGPRGNFSRFMNNSCQPNCETQKWNVNGDIRIGLFAITDIPAGTELTFNYNMDCFGCEKVSCKCGSSICSGFLGVRPKTAAAMETELKTKQAEIRRQQKKLQSDRKMKKALKSESLSAGEVTGSTLESHSSLSAETSSVHIKVENDESEIDQKFTAGKKGRLQQNGVPPSASTNSLSFDSSQITNKSYGVQKVHPARKDSSPSWRSHLQADPSCRSDTSGTVKRRRRKPKHLEVFAHPNFPPDVNQNGETLIAYENEERNHLESSVIYPPVKISPHSDGSLVVKRRGRKPKRFVAPVLPSLSTQINGVTLRVGKKRGRKPKHFTSSDRMNSLIEASVNNDTSNVVKKRVPKPKHFVPPVLANFPAQINGVTLLVGKKRGRKPKHFVSAIHAGSLATISQNGVAVPVGKKRGRKLKHVPSPDVKNLPADVSMNSSLVGKKRGRKPKQLVSPVPSIPPAEIAGNCVTSLVGRKRGRKPKNFMSPDVQSSAADIFMLDNEESLTVLKQGIKRENSSDVGELMINKKIKLENDV